MSCYDEYDIRITLAEINLFPGLSCVGRAEPLATSFNYPCSINLMDKEKY